MRVVLELDGKEFEVALVAGEDGSWQAEVDGVSFDLDATRSLDGVTVQCGDRRFEAERPMRDAMRVDGEDVPFRILGLQGVAGADAEGAGGGAKVRPPMPGRLEAVLVKAGDVVEKGQVLFVLEAMKMHNEVKAPSGGVVERVEGAAGDAVEPGAVVVEIAPAPA